MTAISTFMYMQGQTNKTRQSNTAHPRQSLFLEKNELPRVGLEPTTLYTLDSALYQLSYMYMYCQLIGMCNGQCTKLKAMWHGKKAKISNRMHADPSAGFLYPAF